MTKTKVLGLVGTFLLAAACAACGGGDDGNDGSAPSGPSANGGSGGGESSSEKDFELASTSPTAIVRRTSGGNIALHVGGGGAVTLEIDGLPAGIRAEVEPIGAGTSDALIPLSFASDAPEFGEHPIVIRGRSGERTRELAVQLVVADDAGALDSTFGAKGLLTGKASITAQAMTVDSQGRTFVVGADATTKTYVTRYTSAGEADATFDGDGVVPISFDPVLQTIPVAISTSKASDAAYVAGGRREQSGKAQPCVAKIDGKGALDGGFGSAGVACIVNPLLGDFAAIMTVSALDDGATVASGVCGSAGQLQDMFILKLDAKGAPDSGFGVGGVVRFPLPTTMETPAKILVDGKGRVVVAGQTVEPGKNPSSFVVRLTGGGEADPWFGKAGMVVMDRGGAAAFVQSMALGPNDEIYLAGSEDKSPAIYALDAEKGEPLASFGTNGAALYADHAPAAFMALAWDEGKLIAAGSRQVNAAWVPIALRASSSNGALDATFGKDGTITLPVGSGVKAAAVAPSSRAVMLMDAPTGYVVARTWR